MTRRRIAIVGVGPRGLSVLERILSHATQTRVGVDVLLIEPADIGVGVHHRDQPAYLILNTVAGQATTFSDPDMVPGKPTMGGPSFLSWCRMRGIRRPADCHVGDQTGPVENGDFLPRRLFGEYLAWSAAWLLDRTPDNVSVTVIPHIATVVRAAPKGRAAVTVASGVVHVVDLAFVTTGHGLARGVPAVSGSSAPVIKHPYPLPQVVTHIPNNCRVGIAGTGLAAVDVIAALTVGRGGVFAWNRKRVSYVASGREPEIIMYNRTGWLPCARPRDPRRIPKRQAHALTPAAIARLRETRADGRLDFREDVMPLIRREIVTSGLNDREQAAAVRMLALEPRSWRSSEVYRRDVHAQAKWDAREAYRGLERSRYKDAMEALRDQRETLRSVLEDPGLTAEGHIDFFRFLPPLANRTAVGPQVERLLEILALIDAGIVRLGPGPSPRADREGAGWLLTSTLLQREERVAIDWLIEAHVDWPAIDGIDDPMACGLRAWTSPHPHNSRYLDLTAQGAVKTRRGEVVAAIVVIGPPAEGSTYYNNYILWPGAWSRVLSDIDYALETCLSDAAVAPRVKS